MEIVLVPIFAIIAYFAILAPKVSLAITLFVLYTQVSLFVGPVFLPMVAITLLSLVLYMLFKEELTIAYLPINKFIFLFLTSILISLFHTQDWIRAEYDLSIFFRSLVLFFLIVYIIKDENTLIGVIKTIVIAVLFGSIIALYEYRVAVTRIFLFGGRTGSVLEDPNFFASMVISVLPLSIFLTKRERKWSLRSFWGISTVVLLLSIVPTFSRAGMLALAVALFLVILYERRNKWTWILFSLLIISSFAVVPIDFWIRAMTIVRPGRDFAIGHRTLLLISGIQVFLQYPLLGVGIGDFISAVSRYMTTPKVAHNMYLHIFVETGILGGTFFLCILWNLLWSIHREKQTSDLAVYIEISLIGLFITALFLSIHFHFWVWSLLGIASVFLRVRSSNIEYEKKD